MNCIDIYRQYSRIQPIWNRYMYASIAIKTVFLTLIATPLLAVGTPPSSPRIGQRRVDHSKAFVAALFSRDPTKLRRLLECEEVGEVAIQLSRDITIEIEGFQITGSAMFIATRLGRINAIKAMLDFAEEHPEVVVPLLRRGAGESGPLHWALENRSDVRRVVIEVPGGDREIDFEVIERMLPIPSAFDSARRYEMVNPFLQFIVRLPQHANLLLGPNINGETPLHVAVGSAWHMIVRTFLQSPHAHQLLINPELLNLDSLDANAASAMLQELLLVRPELLGSFVMHPSFKSACILENALAARNLVLVQGLLQLARERPNLKLVQVDSKALNVLWDTFEVSNDDHRFMYDLWDLDWTGHGEAIDAINLCWNRRLYPRAFSGSQLLPLNVLAAHMSLQLTGRLQWPD